MAKISIGSYVLEGTIDELKQMGVKFPVEEAESETDTLKVGDYAKIVTREGGHEFSIGEVVQIIGADLDDSEYLAENLDGGITWYLNKNEVVRATDEEVAEAKRKLAEKEIEAKWAKIGRKPGEFKKGDIVKYLGELREVNEYKPLKRKSDGMEFIAHENGITLGENEYWTHYKNVELIAPVEARFQ